MTSVCELLMLASQARVFEHERPIIPFFRVYLDTFLMIMANPLGRIQIIRTGVWKFRRGHY